MGLGMIGTRAMGGSGGRPPYPGMPYGSKGCADEGGRLSTLAIRVARSPIWRCSPWIVVVRASSVVAGTVIIGGLEVAMGMLVVTMGAMVVGGAVAGRAVVVVGATEGTTATTND